MLPCWHTAQRMVAKKYVSRQTNLDDLLMAQWTQQALLNTPDAVVKHDMNDLAHTHSGRRATGYVSYIMVSFDSRHDLPMYLDLANGVLHTRRLQVGNTTHCATTWRPGSLMAEQSPRQCCMMRLDQSPLWRVYKKLVQR